MENEKKKRVVLCIPGKSFSNIFLMQWTEAVMMLSKTYDIAVSNNYSSFVPFARASCLGASVERGASQAPFNGDPYDVIVWIDSDIVFNWKQVADLIESTNEHPVVSGYYMMEGGKQFAFVKEWNNAYFIENKSYEFATAETLEKHKDDTYIPCAYAGMGFMAVRRGVVEAIPYPWFFRDVEKIPVPGTDNTWVDMCSEDVAFCRNIIEKGGAPAIMVKVGLRVGHEKRAIF